MATAAIQLRLWDSSPAEEQRRTVPPRRGGVRPGRVPLGDAERDQGGSAERSAPCAEEKAAASEDRRACDPGAASGGRDILAQLRQQVRQVETAGRPSRPAISTGVGALDQMLPEGGLAPGTLAEWVATGPASGAGWLALHAAARAAAAAAAGGAVVILDTTGTFYPPAAWATGLPAERVILVRPATASDALWAADQALRCRSVAAVWGSLPRLDDRQARRLQLAAETGGTLGLLVRPLEALRQPSWAEVRWQVTGLPGQRGRRLEARLARCRGGRAGASVVLEIDACQGTIRAAGGSHDVPESALHLAARLAHPAVAKRTHRGGGRIRSA